MPDATAPGMNTARLASLGILALLLSGPALLAAQSDRPGRGKIDGVEREGRRSGHRGHDHDDDEGGGGFFGFIIGLFHSDDEADRSADPPVTLPPTPGRGSQDYPSADTADSNPFLREHVLDGHGFGNLSATYFDDNAIGGTLQAGQVAWEGAIEEAYASVEYTLYREPTRTDVDWLHTLRLGVGGIPRLGQLGYLKVGPALRVVVLDNGRPALGPELEVGAELLPHRPWGVGGTARGALVKWTETNTWSGMADLTAHASVYLGRLELMAGWRYMVIGSAPAFNGPTAGVRLWF